MNKKVLIITYYWPPAGGPGVQRWLKFVKYLPEFQIEPIVYCPSNPNYPIVDESLLSEVSDEVTVLKQPIKEPYKFAGFLSNKSKTISKGIIPENKKLGIIEKLMLYVRGNFFIPDARKGWIKPSVAYLSTYISDYKIDTIITSGPPHSLHLIGLQLKENLGVQWIADFRDPWTSIGYHKKLRLTQASQKKHKNLEKQVLTTADKIIVTSNNTKKEFQQLTKQPITVITNGYDVEKPQAIVRDSKFSLAHIGSFLSERNPEILWKVLHDLRNEDKDFKSDFQLKLVGAVSDSVVQSISKYSLNDCLNNVGYVSHNEAIVHQKQTQLLLLVEIDSDETKAIIPGKLFEYMVSERPIIAIGPIDSDVEDILKETNTGSYFNYGDYEALKSTIKTHYKAFKRGDLKTQAIGLQKYSRRNVTKSLAELL
ncbi:glycosyltransferase family 4 protein [Bizionia gelidisalsuginis]|uniref:Glycosyltransferase family 4 protein n=1 Tax=Bizionia gelidisalsuginis TaxID=291188 RepID=A0ABY3MC28_9FLAO|nr:glycosyltransferase family 4 protein [Bizionia gelidisalsuginis]TYC14880.1 glycosyltransferase family 4 protein [Bizionia gelidisalsuginis]